MSFNIFCDAVEAYLHRTIDINERRRVYKYFKKNKVNDIDNHHLECVRSILTEGMKNGETAVESDVATIEALFLLEAGSVYDLSKAVVPQSKLKYSYLLLDSDNCFDITTSRDKFTWLLQEEHVKLQTGNINLHAKMRNIVMARLGRVSCTHMHGDFVTTVLNRNRFAIGFEEFASQALITPYNTKFQFITFLSEADRNYGTNVVLSPFNANRGWFRFREPFKMLDKLTMSITNLNTAAKVILPDTPFSFPGIHIANQRFATDFDVINGPLFVNNSHINIPFDYYFGLLGYEFDAPANTEEQFIISNYSSGDPAIDVTWNGTRHIRNSGGSMVFGITTNSNYNYNIGSSIPPYLSVPPYIEIPLTITLTYNPRFMAVLELVSEED